MLRSPFVVHQSGNPFVIGQSGSPYSDFKGFPFVIDHTATPLLLATLQPLCMIQLWPLCC
jgi:hypothetical protein